MQANYKAFIDRMISKYEGGYGWDKADPGGPTKYGITCYDLAEHRGQRMTSMSAWAPIVHDMKLDEAETIYEKKYAQAISFDKLNSGVDCVMMDYAVNSGIARANRVARVLTGQPAGTAMDTALLQAVNAQPADKFIDNMCDERLRFMHNIRGGTAWEQFGKGWGARVTDLRVYSHNAVKNQPTPVSVDLSKVSTPKARNVNPQDGTAINPKTIGTTATVGGGSWFAGVHWEYLVIGGVVVVVGLVAFEIWKSHSARKADEVVHV